MFDNTIQAYISALKNLISSETLRFDDRLHGKLPQSAGVYRILEADDDLNATMYIGTSNNLRDRIYHNLLMGDINAHTLRKKLLRQPFCNNEQDVKNYLKSNCLCQYLIIDNRQERHLFEHFAISVLKPEYND